LQPRSGGGSIGENKIEIEIEIEFSLMSAAARSIIGRIQVPGATSVATGHL
jgi:hypothetical protein